MDRKISENCAVIAENPHLWESSNGQFFSANAMHKEAGAAIAAAIRASNLGEPRWNSENIGQWADDTFGPASALSTTIRALRELLELAELLSRSNEPLSLAAKTMQMMADEFQKMEKRQREFVVTDQAVGPKVMDEVADVRIVLCRVQRFFQNVLTAEQAEQQKMEINVRRTWKLDGAGHGQHV